MSKRTTAKTGKKTTEKLNLTKEQALDLSIDTLHDISAP